MIKKLSLALIGISFAHLSFAFNNDDHITDAEITAKINPDFTHYFNEDKTKFAQFNLWSQVWVRHSDLNPGSKIGDEAATSFTDIGLRRLRISGLLQLKPRYRVYVQAGINNQSFNNGGGNGTGSNGAGKKPAFFIHDIYNEYTLVKKTDRSLNIGAGLHGWQGVSRLSNGSSNKILGADFPLIQFPYLERGDQFGRQLGVFAQGNWKKINYRATLNKPFKTNLQPTQTNVAVDHNSRTSLHHGGYAYYQFFETEQQSNPYLSGSYLGEKKIVNIGLGYSHTAKNTMSMDVTQKLKQHNNTIMGIDIFAELPFTIGSKKSSITAYSVYYDYQMGPNYLRTNGVMNPATLDSQYSGPLAFEGHGNNIALIGTGRSWFSQVGWLLPNNSNKIGFQPFAGYNYKNFKVFQQSINVFNIGTNVLLDKHNAKFSLQYTSHPIYHMQTLKTLQRNKEFIVQAQILL